ncbi:MAG: PEP-CTERM sorting domain-containing protein [Phycisphaerae bacterium]|nr:PEP-CTERM sorting domain-containing protein [Phycisphaerae bacterium]
MGQYYDADWGGHGFLYDGSSWTTLDYPGAIYTHVYGIDGANIVGHYRDASGDYHGFSYTIPEPATLSLLVLGGLLMARRRR